MIGLHQSEHAENGVNTAEVFFIFFLGAWGDRTMQMLTAHIGTRCCGAGAHHATTQLVCALTVSSTSWLADWHTWLAKAIVASIGAPLSSWGGGELPDGMASLSLGRQKN